MGITHFSDIRGDDRSAGGLLQGAPIALATLREVISYANDFLVSEEFAVGDWGETAIGTASGQDALLRLGEAGGVLRVGAGTAASTGIQVALSGGTGGQVFSHAQGWLAWEVRVNIPTLDGAIAFGIGVETAALLGTDGSATGRDGLFVVKPLGSGTLNLYVASDTAATNLGSLGTVAAATWVRVGARRDGNRIRGYLNGRKVLDVSTTVTSGVGNVQFAAVNDSAATNEAIVDVDYVIVAAAR